MQGAASRTRAYRGRKVSRACAKRGATVLRLDGYVVFFLLSLLDWPIILIAGLGTWFLGRSWIAIIVFCVLAPLLQAALAALAHHTAAFQPILLLIGFANGAEPMTRGPIPLGLP